MKNDFPVEIPIFLESKTYGLSYIVARKINVIDEKVCILICKLMKKVPYPKKKCHYKEYNGKLNGVSFPVKSIF